MHISQPSNNPILVNTTAQSVSLKGSQSASTAAPVNDTKNTSTPSAGVAVTVSSMARAMGATSRGEPAEVDMNKVNAVREAIRQGSYSIDAEAIADKLLGNAQEMLDQNRNTR